MDFRDHLRVLRRTLRLLVVLAVVGSLLGAAAGLLQERRYAATARAYVSVSSARTLADLTSGAAFAQQAAQAYAGVATTTFVLRPVIASLDLGGSPAQLAERVDASVAGDSSMVSITVTAGTAAEAARTANEIVAQLRTAALDLTPPTTTGTGTTAVTAASIALTPVDPAVAPTAPVGPSAALLALLGALLGAVLAMAVGLLREVLDTRVRTTQDLQRVTDLPLLGTTVRDAEVVRQPLVVDVASTSARAEGYRSLRTNLRFLEVDDAARSLVVTSSVEGEGKSVTAANVALAIAALGRRVLLVDADLRRPRVAQCFGVDGAVGLTDVLTGAVDLRDAVQAFGRTGLQLLPAGSLPPNPNELLQSRAMHELMQRLHAEYEMVLFDTPPLLAVTDAVVLGEQAGAVVVVAASGRVRRPQLADALAALERGSARVAGLVLTLVPRSSADAPARGYGSAEVLQEAEAVEPEHRGRAARRDRRRARSAAAPVAEAPAESVPDEEPVEHEVPVVAGAVLADLPAPVPALRHFVRPVLWNDSLVPVVSQPEDRVPTDLEPATRLAERIAPDGQDGEGAAPRPRHRRTWSSYPDLAALAAAEPTTSEPAASAPIDAAPPASAPAPAQLSLLPSRYEPELDLEVEADDEAEVEPDDGSEPEVEIDPDFEAVLQPAGDAEPGRRERKPRRERRTRTSSSAKPVRIPPPPQLTARLQQQGSTW